MNEITDNDDVIGILFKTGVKEFELRRGICIYTPLNLTNSWAI